MELQSFSQGSAWNSLQPWSSSWSLSKICHQGGHTVNERNHEGPDGVLGCLKPFLKLGERSCGEFGFDRGWDRLQWPWAPPFFNRLSYAKLLFLEAGISGVNPCCRSGLGAFVP